jgi:hypothetical protein
MVPEKMQQSDKGQKTFKWDVWKENPGIWGKADFVINGFVDHINTTKDTTDYLWHTTRFVSVYKMVKNTNSTIKRIEKCLFIILPKHDMLILLL